MSPWSALGTFPSYNIPWRHKVLYDICYDNFTGTNYLDISLASCDSLWGTDDFSYKNSGGGGPHFHVIAAWSLCQKKLIFHNIISVSKRYMAYRRPNGTCTIPHSYA